jgi:hypothetical protein
MDNFDKKTHKSYRTIHAAQKSIVLYCTTTISIAALATFSPIKAAPHVEIVEISDVLVSGAALLQELKLVQ